jgi:hypothetical protein
MNSRRRPSPWATPRQVERYSSLRDLAVTYEGRNEAIPARPPDISPRGMFINTARQFPEGAVLKLRFCLNRSKVEVSTRCEVRYCLPGVGVGVEFVQLSPEDARAIENEIDLSNHPRPSRKKSRQTSFHALRSPSCTL